MFFKTSKMPRKMLKVDEHTYQAILKYLFGIS